MAYYLAVANRKGGVGKSTLSVMLAQAFAVWGNKRVLVLDLDSQCNASLILIGGQGWSEARRASKTIADYFYDLFDGIPAKPRDYLVANVGDVLDEQGRPARINLLPGSLLLEDIQGELFLKQSRESNNPDVVASRVRGRIETLLKRFGASYDLVILDCAPGLSLAALAALTAADKVLVPFRPDYVSQLAVDRISLLIENKGHLDALSEIPFDERRYVTVANGVRGGGKDRVLIEDISAFHPMLTTEMPYRDAIANAFDWESLPKRIGEKYGEGTADLERLYNELRPMIETASAAEATQRAAS